MTKLLYLVTEDWYFCSHRLELATAALNADYDVYLVTQVTHHADFIRSEKIKLYPVIFSRSYNRPWQDIKTLINIFKIYREIQPDIVHHVALKPVMFGSLICLFMKKNKPKAVVNAMTGLGSLFISKKPFLSMVKSIFSKLLVFFLQRKNSHLIVQNNDDKALFIDEYHLPLEKISLIKGSGVNINTYKPALNKSKLITVMLVARMLKDKGVEEFISAVSLLEKQGQSARFVLVGDTDKENPSSISTARLEEWNKKGIIEWWGQCDNMVSVYEQANIVVLPSYREGLPKVLLEAAACGLPIVATDVPGCRVIVKHGVNGLLVAVRDADELAAAISQLINNPELCKEMGSKGRDMVEKEFSSNIVIDKTLMLYQSLLTSP